MTSRTDRMLQTRDAAIRAIEQAFETMNAEAAERLTCALGDAEKAVTVVVWLPGPRIDICTMPADQKDAPEIILSRHFGH